MRYSKMTTTKNEFVKLISVTPNAERHIAYCARVSNPKNQFNNSSAGLLKYCIQNQHWSIFEHAFLTVEINTSLAIATQILRHRSFTFQQFSQRYADSTELQLELPIPELRKQDTKNRQNSTDDLDPVFVDLMQKKIKTYFEQGISLYKYMLDNGVAKESARFILPQATQTRMYMSGSIRSWIHYIDLRSAHGTQLEHKKIAERCKCIFVDEFPTIAAALDWVCFEPPSLLF